MDGSFAIESGRLNSVDNLKIMPTETQIADPAVNLISNYRGSENTKKKVEEQIRQRFGEEAATAYDPRRNCLTFRLWLKKGYRVKMGEKAIRSVTLLERKDAKGNVIGRFPKSVFLFYQSQVEPVSTSSNTL